MELIINFADFFIHLDRYLASIIGFFGCWTYFIFFLIIFCETGLVVTPFLPGDSLLFGLGTFAAMGALQIEWLLFLLAIAAVAGNMVNYAIGKFVGPKVFHKENARFLNKEYLDRTHGFYEKHGGKTIVIARFIPIIRTFAPFVAGIGKMSYSRFSIYNIVGSIAWVVLFICGGYYFGNLPAVRRNFTMVVFAIIAISVLPMVIGYVRSRNWHISGKTVERHDDSDDLKTKIMKKTTLFLILGLIFCSVTTVRAESQSIVKIGSDLTIEEGTKVYNVLVVDGQITVEGTVENRVVAIGGSVVLAKKAVVGGNVFCLGGIVVRGRGADVTGSITEINSNDISQAVTNALSEEWEGWSWIFAVISMSIFLGILIITVVTVLLIPKPVRLISAAIKEKPFKVTAWGLSGLVLIVPLAVLLAISVVGIVLIPLEMTIVLCSVLLGFISVSQLVGRKLFTVLKRNDQSMMRETIWGLVVLWLIGWIPYVGWMIKVCAIVLGMGAVLSTRFGTNQHL